MKTVKKIPFNEFHNELQFFFLKTVRKDLEPLFPWDLAQGKEQGLFSTNLVFDKMLQIRSDCLNKMVQRLST